MSYIGFLIILLPTLLLTMMQFKSLKHVNATIIKQLKLITKIAVILGFIYVCFMIMYKIVTIDTISWRDVVERVVIMLIAALVSHLINREITKIEQEEGFNREQN
jgi:hypothetical protein